MAGSSLADSIIGGFNIGFNDQSGYSNTTQNSTQSGVTSTVRNPSIYTQPLQGSLFNYITQLMSNPAAALQPYQTAARNQVNSTYSGLADQLRSQFLATGGGSSGKYGLALAGADVSRLGQLSDVDTGFQQSAAALPLQVAPLSAGIINSFMGGSTAANGTASGTSSANSGSSGFKFGI